MKEISKDILKDFDAWWDQHTWSGDLEKPIVCVHPEVWDAFVNGKILIIREDANEPSGVTIEAREPKEL